MEAVVLSGIQGSGKTTLYVERFLATHVRISRDLLRTPHREARFLELALETRQPLVVDSINPTPDDRRPYVEAARKAGYRTIAYVVEALPRDAIARNAQRTERWRVPVPAILGTHKRLVAPTLEEGFDEVWRAWADARGGGMLVEQLAASAPAEGDARFTRGVGDSTPSRPPLKSPDTA